MSIATIEESFTEAERADLGEFEQGFKRVTSGRDREDWRSMVPGLVILSKAAMQYAGTNERRGKTYNAIMGELVLEHARRVSNRVNLTEIKAMMQSFSYLLWLTEGHDRLAVLDAELDRMPLSRRIRVNSPIMMYKLVKAAEDARHIPEAKAEPEQPKKSDTQLLKELVAAKDREITNMRRMLDNADGGSLFDWQADPVDEIARILYENKPRVSKALDLAKAITEHHQRMVGEKKAKKPKMAG